MMIKKKKNSEVTDHDAQRSKFMIYSVHTKNICRKEKENPLGHFLASASTFSLMLFP